MRKRIAFILGAALIVGLQAGPAAAGPPITSGEFAADCNADGQVVVADDLRVFGGAGVLNDGPCSIQMAPNASLMFRDATLTGDAVFLTIGDAQEHTRVTVIRSTFAFTSDDGSAIQLSPGCCAGEPEPGRDEHGGTVSVLDSTLSAGTVEVSGSLAADDGTASVRRSVLEGAATWSDNPVSVLASLTGVDGTAQVTQSQLISPTGISISTGDAGSTLATSNTFTFTTAVTITTGTGGTCTSSGNTPPVACT